MKGVSNNNAQNNNQSKAQRDLKTYSGSPYKQKDNINKDQKITIIKKILLEIKFKPKY